MAPGPPTALLWSASFSSTNPARTIAGIPNRKEKRAAAEALAEWLPQVVAVDMKEERKKLKLAMLRGEA